MTLCLTLRYQWRRIPLRTRMGLLIAMVAIAGLAWQHYSSVETQTAAPGSDQQTADSEFNNEGHDHDDDGYALGEYQPDPSELPAPPDFSPEAARVTAERFAMNFAAPGGNRDDWLTRISGDVMPELLDQYRLTDIRNVPQAAVTQVSGPMAADPAAPTFQVLYSDASSVEVTLEMAVDGWKVSTVVPVDSPATPADPAPAAPPAPPAPSADTTTPAVPGPGVFPISQPTP